MWGEEGFWGRKSDEGVMMMKVEVERQLNSDGPEPKEDVPLSFHSRYTSYLNRCFECKKQNKIPKFRGTN